MNAIWMRSFSVLALLAFVLAACGEPTPTPTVQEQVEEVQSALALAGTNWELESMGEESDDIGVVEGTRPAVSYQVDRYGGSDGCNWYLGVYDLDGDQLTMQTPATTLIYCQDEELVSQQATFMAALLNTERAAMEGDNLVLYATGDQRMLTLKPAEPVPFEGTKWALRGLRSGEQIGPILYQTEPFVVFESGKLTGNGGCNDFAATFTVDGDNMTISQPAGTMESCEDPKGVMDQETEFMSLLPQTTGYLQLGGTLALLNDQEQALLIFGYAGE